MRKLLAEKQQWCRRTISLLDKLDPGMSLSRGGEINDMAVTNQQRRNLPFRDHPLRDEQRDSPTSQHGI